MFLTLRSISPLTSARGTVLFVSQNDFGKSTRRDPWDDDDDDDDYDVIPSRTRHVFGVIPDNTCICTWQARQTLPVRRALQPCNPGNLEDVAQSSAGVILPIWAADYPRRRGQQRGRVRVAKLWFDSGAITNRNLRANTEFNSNPYLTKSVNPLQIVTRNRSATISNNPR